MTRPSIVMLFIVGFIEFLLPTSPPRMEEEGKVMWAREEGVYGVGIGLPMPKTRFRMPPSPCASCVDTYMCRLSQDTLRSANGMRAEVGVSTLPLHCTGDERCTKASPSVEDVGPRTTVQVCLLYLSALFWPCAVAGQAWDLCAEMLYRS